LERLVIPYVKNDIIQGSGYQGKNDITWGQAESTSIPPDQKVNKAEELTYPPINIDSNEWFCLTAAFYIYNTNETSHYYYLVCVHVLNPVLVGEHVFDAKNLVEMLQNFFFTSSLTNWTN